VKTAIFDVSESCPELEATTGVSQGRVGQAPAIVRQMYGEGSAALLNFIVPYKSLRCEGGWEKIQAVIRPLVERAVGPPPVIVRADNGPPVPGLEIVRYRDELGEYIGLLWAPPELAQPMQDVTVRVPNLSGYLYDVLTSGFLGSASDADVRLRAQDGPIYLLGVLPYETKCVKLTPSAPEVRQGGLLTIGIRVLRRDNSVARGPHVVRVEFTGPNGVSRPFLTQRTRIRGEGQIEWRTALNDPLGSWRVRATEIVTHATGETRVVVRPRNH